MTILRRALLLLSRGISSARPVAAPLAGVALLLATAACGDDGSSTTATTSNDTTNSTLPGTTSTSTSTSTSNTNSTGETTGGGTTSTGSSTTGEPTAEYDGNIVIPELLQGTEFELVMDEGSHAFTASGTPSNTAGYNGDLLGPTLEWVQGDNISITVTNNLASDTTTHWHGAHVSPVNDGGPHQMIGSGGGTWSPAFEVMNTAATMWYHPHLHEDTADQVRMGLSGFIIVRDDVEAALDLPRQYGVDDLPLVLQDKQLDANGVLQTMPDRGNTMTVNGAADAFREVPGQMVRLRLLNGSLELAYNLTFDDGRTFNVIGNDLGLLAAPAPVTSLRLAPGERYEVVVDFSADEGDSVTLRALNTALPMGVIGGMGMMQMGIEGTDFDVIQFDVVPATGDATMTLPATLVTPVIPSEAGAIAHSMVMAPAMPPPGFTLNGSQMELDVINEYVGGDTVEVWTLENTTMIAHPFHIHDIHFYILDRDADGPGPGAAVEPEAWEAGPKDTVLVQPLEEVRFIAEFSDFAFDPTDPGGVADAAYMYHCHILPHEDGGMMGQFAVCPAGSGTCPPP